jgi:hypothetical protein
MEAFASEFCVFTMTVDKPGQMKFQSRLSSAVLQKKKKKKKKGNIMFPLSLLSLCSK